MTSQLLSMCSIIIKLEDNVFTLVIDISLYVYTTTLHIHNAWLLERSEMEIDFPTDLFDSPLKLFLFCRNMKIIDLVEKDNIASFDFHTLIFAATYLMIDDKYLVAILNFSYVRSYKENKIKL